MAEHREGREQREERIDGGDGSTTLAATGAADIGVLAGHRVEDVIAGLLEPRVTG